MGNTMKKAVIHAPRQARLVDVPIPEPRGDLVLIRVRAVPMCTEYKTWESGRTAEALGHEGVGEVAAVDGHSDLAVGDRVVILGLFSCGTCRYCRAGHVMHCMNKVRHPSQANGQTGSPPRTGAYAQFRLARSWMLPRIPDDISFEQAALTWCGLGPTFGAMQRMAVDAFDTVLVTGAGPVGLGALVNAASRGARAIVVEGVPWRVERARAMGAAAVLDPADPELVAHIRSLTTDGLGVDCAVECAGVVAAQRVCVEAARPRGQVAFVAECNEELPIRVSPDMIRTGLTLIGQWHYSMNDFERLLAVVRSSPLLDQHVSHRLPLSRVQEALELCASHQCGKVILDPWK
ncbi:MAG: zinc-binding dehydrogenase [Spirochaetaceae bacterium]|nr:zinc-binding dehydrogenase [Spirochaetaceae bacterium]